MDFEEKKSHILHVVNQKSKAKDIVKSYILFTTDVCEVIQLQTLHSQQMN